MNDNKLNKEFLVGYSTGTGYGDSFECNGSGSGNGFHYGYGYYYKFDYNSENRTQGIGFDPNAYLGIGTVSTNSFRRS